MNSVKVRSRSSGIAGHAGRDNASGNFRTHAGIRYERRRGIRTFAEFGLPDEMHDYNSFRAASGGHEIKRRKLENLVMNIGPGMDANSRGPT